jgi:Transposase
VKVRDMIWVGIDVGKSHHHACVVDATGETVFSRKLVNGPTRPLPPAATCSRWSHPATLAHQKGAPDPALDNDSDTHILAGQEHLFLIALDEPFPL